MLPVTPGTAIDGARALLIADWATTGNGIDPPGQPAHTIYEDQADESDGQPEREQQRIEQQKKQAYEKCWNIL